MKIKIIYAAVIAVLCITAVVVGIVSVASRKKDPVENENPPITDNEGENEEKGDGSEETGKDDVEEESNKKLTFISPVVGDLTNTHSTEIPVFSATLNEWRVHTGIDIAADEGTDVLSAADGTVTRVYSDPFLGQTVEITHEGGIVSVYSNLGSTGITVAEGDVVSSGAKIGVVGDTSLSELADEPHLHFQIKLEGVSVNPLDYISEESQKVSLGINEL